MATREVVFPETLIPGQTVYVDYACPVNGEIKSIIRQWPRGSNGLVDIAVGHNDKWVLPNLTDRYVALDDATIIVTITGESVTRGEILWVRFRNRDAVNNHSPNVTIVVAGEE